MPFIVSGKKFRHATHLNTSTGASRSHGSLAQRVHRSSATPGNKNNELYFMIIVATVHSSEWKAAENLPSPRVHSKGYKLRRFFVNMTVWNERVAQRSQRVSVCKAALLMKAFSDFLQFLAMFDAICLC